MEDSFRVRVDKVFGSLASSSSSSASSSTTPLVSSSLWCLTDEEIERDRWIREKEESQPGPDPLNHSKMENDLIELEEDLDEVDDLEEEDKQLGKPKPDDYNDEEWEIKNSIGTDCTLDYEEEEDRYDKVAVGKEKVGDRLYMSHVNDYGVEIDSCNVLPNSFMEANRDPRANLTAAKIRLEEDAEAAKKMDTLRVTDKDSPAVVNSQAEDVNPKSILKRKEDQLESKQQKRVRFDPECKDGHEESGAGELQMGTDSMEGDNVYPLPVDYPSGIPDYMRNPSKYTRYTFDPSSDVDERSNRQAYMDFLKMLKRSKNAEEEQDDGPIDLPKSVAFVPKKKTNDATMINDCTESKKTKGDTGEESMLKKGSQVMVAAGDTDDTEACDMEEDEPETASNTRKAQKPGRQYRSRANLETDDAF